MQSHHTIAPVDCRVSSSRGLHNRVQGHMLSVVDNPDVLSKAFQGGVARSEFRAGVLVGLREGAMAHVQIPVTCWHASLFGVPLVVADGVMGDTMRASRLETIALKLLAVTKVAGEGDAATFGRFADGSTVHMRWRTGKSWQQR